MNKKDLNLLLPLLSIILAVASYFVCSNLLISPILENRAKIEALNQDIAGANQKLDSISAADKSITELSDTVNSLLIAVPSDVDSPDLITEIEAIANQNQVALPTMSPPTKIQSGSSDSGLTTNLTISGSFQNISGFINSLETSIRFSKVNSLTITQGDAGLSVAINFNVYYRPTTSISSGAK
ncbi:MAG: type 4a pilus biogenesis protein PilO [Candidatus Berkelbacteria bacterium]|nr:type 4a pilus biogenesis protein PilO [Candidatus Berkelbacteria bacterium]